ncbi:cation transporter [Candidatus Thiodiazotropha endoloripes]|uniref:efflux RND transporter permease subunit n=1 Tax=Candidatus Thiodiazotropha endoloripes TaxID=1818881 RepID=UPI00083CD23D|nr:efflux RND transporter permease subunit [Candidatus Thiodiazotropha endoloripes]ODB89523.1 cation transporter [Candidatus Thiodiazotropha endoloripes]
MPGQLIRWSIENRVLVLLASLIIAIWGWNSLRETPLDALPDLSDVQVIIQTNYPGQAPQVVEDQVTYPITTTMLSVPGAKAVRGYSFFGDSYVYVVFEDGTDIYWARSRVLEYLNQASSDLPSDVQPKLGPDASGVGWIYSYALVDRHNRHDLSQLRSLQDWFLKYELQSVSGVAEVASVGGMVRQYQIVLSPEKLRALSIPISQAIEAVKQANYEVGGSVIEQGEAELMVRTRGYLKSEQDIRHIPIDITEESIPILLQDIANIQIGPEMRRVVADLDGLGEVTGGIVVMRHGENALATIKNVKRKLQQLKSGLPEGVEIIETYDRSTLIEESVDNLSNKLLEEFIVVALICLLFLFHFRSAVVAVITLPMGILIAFIIMRQQGINANIMSLGGIAIAIGTMVDAAIVMIENAHRRLQERGGGLPREEHWKVILEASLQVGPALFYSLLIITLSFLPVLALEGQEGRLFGPLVYTKTYAMAAAAGLAVTLVPVLMGYLLKGWIPAESSNPLSWVLITLYRPLLRIVLWLPRPSLLLALLLVVTLVIPIYGIGGLLEPLKWPLKLSRAAGLEYSSTLIEQIDNTQLGMQKAWRKGFSESPMMQRLGQGLGSEFMPDLFEGDLMYMPTTLPGLSIGKAQELLQQTDRLIMQVAEVERVFGKIGRADSATDPAPLTMIETIIRLKPREEWREGVTLNDIIAELDRTVRFPGLTNAWLMPIKTRIDMLSTGIKTPIGIKVSGPDLKTIEQIGRDIEKQLSTLPETRSAFSDRVVAGRYIEIVPDRLEAARLGINIDDINLMVSAAVGGINISETVEGLERYPINIRFPRELRDDIKKLSELPIITPSGAQVPLTQVARVDVVDGPPLIKTENARLNGWTFIDIKDGDLGGYISKGQQLLEQNIKLPAGYAITWTGQYEYMLRAEAKLKQLVPMLLIIIFALLYLIFRRYSDVLVVMLSIPFALVGGFWFVLMMGYNLSVAVAVGFIALAGIATEFGVVMLIYINSAIKSYQDSGRLTDRQSLKLAIIEGAALRVRPKAMTVLVVVIGLMPIMLSDGAGSEVMQRIAAPVIGGMLTAPLLSLFVIPALVLLIKRRSLPGKH